jgi:hypothetical protein
MIAGWISGKRQPMNYYLTVVEGAHDAALVGVLLKERGFERVQSRAKVDPFWGSLIPTQFPSNPQGRLDHVVKFPDFYENRTTNPEQSVAVAAAGGYDKLIVELQASLDALGASGLSGIAVVADADDVIPAQRFGEIQARLNKVSEEGETNKVDGFPLIVPAVPGFANGPNPRLGVYILPDNLKTGTLETLLLECATASYAPYHKPAVDFVSAIIASRPPDTPELRPLRSNSGGQKATANIIGNLLHPGCSLGTAIERGNWLQNLTGTEIGIELVRQFLGDMLRA